MDLSGTEYGILPLLNATKICFLKYSRKLLSKYPLLNSEGEQISLSGLKVFYRIRML